MLLELFGEGVNGVENSGVGAHELEVGLGVVIGVDGCCGRSWLGHWSWS